MKLFQHLTVPVSQVFRQPVRCFSETPQFSLPKKNSSKQFSPTTHKTWNHHSSRPPPPRVGRSPDSLPQALPAARSVVPATLVNWLTVLRAGLCYTRAFGDHALTPQRSAARARRAPPGPDTETAAGMQIWGQKARLSSPARGKSQPSAAALSTGASRKASGRSKRWPPAGLRAGPCHLPGPRDTGLPRARARKGRRGRPGATPPHPRPGPPGSPVPRGRGPATGVPPPHGGARPGPCPAATPPAGPARPCPHPHSHRLQQLGQPRLESVHVLYDHGGPAAPPGSALHSRHHRSPLQPLTPAPSPAEA